MRAFRTLMMAGLLAASGLVQAVPVKKTADFEGLSAPSDSSVVTALPFNDGGLTLSGNGLVVFDLAVGGASNNALLLTQLVPTDDGDVIDKCPAISCSVTVSFADGFTGLDFDIASYDNRSSGIWPTLEIFGDNGRIGDSISLSNIAPDSVCASGKCQFQNVGVDLTGGAIGRSYTITFGSAAKWIFDQFSVTPLEATPPNRVPEPASFALALAALGGVAVTRRRRGQ